MTLPPRALRQAALARASTIASVVVSAAMCRGRDVAGTGMAITVVPTQSRLTIGDTLRLRATAESRRCDCRWDSSEPTHASVDTTGLVRALAPGWATIIATDRRDPTAKASGLVEISTP